MLVSAWRMGKYREWRWNVIEGRQVKAYGGFSSKLGLKDRQVREIAERVGGMVKTFTEINEHAKAKE